MIKMNGFFGGRNRFFCGVLIIFLLVGCTHAKDDMKIKEVTDPTGRLPLSPFDQWRSAYDCIVYGWENSTCTKWFNLTEKGWVNITKDAGRDYCNKGCSKHNQKVLWCISIVQPHFSFTNGMTVADLNFTINDGCSNGFKNVTLKSSNAWKMYGSKSTTFITALATWFLISFITM